MQAHDGSWIVWDPCRKTVVMPSSARSWGRSGVADGCVLDLGAGYDRHGCCQPHTLTRQRPRCAGRGADQPASELEQGQPAHHRPGRDRGGVRGTQPPAKARARAGREDKLRRVLTVWAVICAEGPHHAGGRHSIQLARRRGADSPDENALRPTRPWSACRCLSWVETPAVMFHLPRRANLWHYLNDGLLLVLQTLLETDLLPAGARRSAFVDQLARPEAPTPIHAEP